jgi:phage tail-like protein
MTMAERADPFPLYNFIVEIEGVSVAGFLEVSGLESSIEVIEYREGTEKSFNNRKLPGLVKYANVVLKSGVTKDKSIYDWHKECVAGVVKRRAVRIVLLDRTSNPIRAWRLREVWPAKYAGPTLNATANEVAIETIELVHEGIDVE